MSRKITVKCFCASDVICNCNAIKNPPSAIRQTAEGIYSVCRKSLFFQKVLVLNPYPQTPFPGKGAILLGLPPLDPVGGYAPATPFSENTKVYRQTETPFRGCFRLFLQSATGCENQPVFFALFHFFIDKTCFCSVLYITRAVRHTVLSLRKEHYYEIIRKTH